MSSPEPTTEVIAQIAEQFDRRGWRDPGDAALTLARALVAGEPPKEAAKRTPTTFLAANGISRETVASVLPDISSVASPDKQVSSRGAVGGRGHSVASARPPSARTSTGAAWTTTVRIALAIAIAIVGSEIVVFGPTLAQWSWLLLNANYYAIISLAEVSVLLSAIGLLFARWAPIALAGAAAIACLAVLGGPVPQS
jgi:hypothetical protein